MSESIDSRVLRDAILRACDRLEACSAELNELDAKLGDGDMGTTLATLARALRPELATPPDDVGECLARVVSVIGRTSGSSLSAVLMTGLHRAARETRGLTAVPWPRLASLIELALDAMSERGGAKLGDKSVLDGLAAIAEALAGESDHAAFADAADRAVSTALAAFRDKPSKIGRARLGADHGVGHDDPGMAALKRVTEAIRSGGN